MAKIGQTKAIRLYGPYLDKQIPGKLAVHVAAPGGKMTPIPFDITDMSPVLNYVERQLYLAILDRLQSAAHAQGFAAGQEAGIDQGRREAAMEAMRKAFVALYKPDEDLGDVEVEED